MNKLKTGFTLVELLAVVLIISIMTSIAVPQYRRSVQRAEAIEAMTNLKTMFDSARRYKSAFSEAPQMLNGLDVTFFDASDHESSTFKIGKFQYSFTDDNVSACRLNNEGAASGTYCLKMFYHHRTEGRDALICEYSANGKYAWLCPAIGKRALSEGSHKYTIEG